MQPIRVKTEIKIINYVDDILLLHQNKEYLKNMTQKVIETLIYFGFTMNTEKSETEPNQTVIFLGWERNLANTTVKTKQKKQASLFLTIMNNQDAQSARLRGWTTTMILNKTAIPDRNQWIVKF
ncbi:MAG: hypothetical protein EZS28_027601 [Streblomastix strix]|uniref:Reverse transcriptase domain-containing protein n=1 Tax=Streblomastix strix TaxID=222440 RepID=A0A5J4V2Z3_9EUKA|nr:MAG: hypothetical protein EZS28_027601 [Streblomastix strix]